MKFTPDGSNPAAAWDLAALLPMRERVPCRGNPGTLTASGTAGDAPAARSLYAELALPEGRVLGPQSRTTLINRANLASRTGRKGDPAAARDRFAELVPVYERVLGPEHPDTLTARGNLARWTGIAGNPGAACDPYAELVPVYERVFGPQHQTTLINRAILASWTGHAGEPQQPPVACTPNWCPCASGSSACNTRPPATLGMSSPTGPSRRSVARASRL